MDETGVTNVADPLGGSWYVEALTDRIEAEAEAIFARIREMGERGRPRIATGEETGDGGVQHAIGPMTSGILRGIEDGWFMSEIAEAAFQYQTSLEKGDKKVVGVNVHTESLTHELEILRVSHEVERQQVQALGERRAARDDAHVRSRLSALVDVARGDGNLVEPMLEAVRAEATLGEICGALREVWGDYREPARF
jgi:methylmalonyl-CoA mutase N-terminal domain/subunit